MRKKVLFLLSFIISTAGMSQDVLHYWHFNSADDDSLYSVQADFTLHTNAPSITYREAYSGLSQLSRMDDVGGSSINARFGEPDGRGIRPRNPADSMELIIELPSTGYEDLELSYATERSGSGMLKQVIYTTTDGSTYIQFGDTVEVETDYELVRFDFTSLTAANDNPDFGIKMLFFEQNTASNGNNRFDNIVLEGTPMAAVTPVSAVAVIPKDVDLLVTETFSLAYEIIPASAADTSVTWSSTDASIVTVDNNGGIEAISVGQAHIVVTTNDGGFTDSALITVTEPAEYDDLIYYWHFNTLEAPEDVKTIQADYSAIQGSAAFMSYEGSSNRDIDDYDPGSGINLHMGESEGIAARVRNRSEDRALIFNLNTEGCDNLRFEYAVHRSGSGMLKNIIEYSTDGGSTYTTSGLPVNEFTITEDYELVLVNFEDIPAVNDNPDFMIRITWEGNTDQENGNNRYDNITLKGNGYGDGVSTRDAPVQAVNTQVYPNPSTGIFMVRTENGKAIHKLTVFDLQGRAVWQQTNQPRFEVDLSAQAKGIYLIKTDTDAGTEIKKVILQ